MKPARLDNVLPDGCALLWHAFIDLRRSAVSNGFGPARITYQDIGAYRRETATALAPWEVDAIIRADSAYLAERAKKQD